ncbi:gasdermin-E-like isoform X3 [Crassostrea virginica]|uniref:Uncharacterized protein LOC111126019 isoform X2 n=1 Tax=Crassostrea virginica TaxID=6565 RepID=A0A8B8DGK4_CRAVI|nr:uncharacterized protein LOC111126019 isoform X2 [Crassostrea virginica]
MRVENVPPHTMFPVVCHKFVHAMGPDTMVPAQSMDAAHDLDLLKVVLRKTKRSYLFWEKVKHTVLDFHLQSLLQNSHVVLDVPSTTKEFCQFNPETKYSLDGKLGVQLMKALMDASLSASDSVTISSKLGAIDEKSLDSEALLEALKSRRLDMTNMVVRQVIESTKQSVSLCIVKDLYVVQKDAEIKRVQTLEEDMDIKEKVKVAPADVDEKVHFDKTGDIVVPGGTPIAFKVWELKVKASDGSITPMTLPKGQGGFLGNLRIDYTDTVDTEKKDNPGHKFVADILNPLVAMPESERGALISSIKTVMASQAEIKRMEHLLSEVEAGDFKETSYSEWMTNSSLDENVFRTILTSTGFDIKDGTLQYPSPPSGVLTACAYVFGALDEFIKRELEQLISCEKEAGIALVEICSQAIGGESIIALPESSTVLAKGTAGRDLAESLGFKINEANNTVTAPSQLTKTFENSYWILYAFFK